MVWEAERDGAVLGPAGNSTQWLYAGGGGGNAGPMMWVVFTHLVVETKDDKGLASSTFPTTGNTPRVLTRHDSTKP
jgi:hypothetical protein